jgi:hypothetical protein
MGDERDQGQPGDPKLPIPDSLSEQDRLSIHILQTLRDSEQFLCIDGRVNTYFNPPDGGFLEARPETFSVEDFLRATDYFCEYRGTLSTTDSDSERMIDVYYPHEVGEATRVATQISSRHIPHILEFAYVLARSI